MQVSELWKGHVYFDQHPYIYIYIEIHIRFLHLEQAGHHFRAKDGSCFFAIKDHGPIVI